MTTFKGFNTIGQRKKFGIVDFELIKRDLLNAFLIRQGQLPGRPDVGTTIWDYVFEPLDEISTEELKSEVQRIVGQDPRIELEQLDISSNHNTVIIEMSVITVPERSVEQLFLVFNQDLETANLFSP